MNQYGIFYGVGVGPGDPDLLTIKAAEKIQQADVVSYIANTESFSLAASIAAAHIAKKTPGTFIEHPVVMPMCNDRTEANKIYDGGAQAIADYLHQGKNVVFLCEGDPLFFGSFAYLHDRLCEAFSIEIIPGICSIHAAAAECGVALGLLKEKIAIISGRHSEAEILNSLQQFENVVIMKAGRPRASIIKLIEQAGRVDESCYIEYATQQQQKVIKNIRELDDSAGPYFSLFLINCRRDYR